MQLQQLIPVAVRMLGHYDFAIVKPVQVGLESACFVIGSDSQANPARSLPGNTEPDRSGNFGDSVLVDRQLLFLFTGVNDERFVHINADIHWMFVGSMFHYALTARPRQVRMPLQEGLLDCVRVYWWCRV